MKESLTSEAPSGRPLGTGRGYVTGAIERNATFVWDESKGHN